MIDTLRRQIDGLAEYVTRRPRVEPRPLQARFDLAQFEDRLVPAGVAPGTLLAAFFDGTYGMTSTVGPDAATAGVTTFSPTSKLETPLFMQPVARKGDVAAGRPEAVVTVGGQVFVAFSQPGVPGTAGNPYAAGDPGTDDASTILTVNPATAAVTTFAVRDRETLALAPSADGKQLLVAWYDGTFSAANPYGAASATSGVSIFDPATGAETPLFSQAAAPRASQLAPPAVKPQALAALGTQVFVAFSQPGAPTAAGNPYSTDDASTITAIDKTTGVATPFAVRGRETLALTASADGTRLVAAFFDGVYSPANPYGPASATSGVSTFDPATAAETPLFSQAVAVRSRDSDPQLAKPEALAATGRQVFVAFSQPGTPGGGANPYGLDDASTVTAIDTATGVATPFAVRPRETLSLTASADGTKLFAASLDGVYSAANPYGPASATAGVSVFDRATAAEAPLFSQAVTSRSRRGSLDPAKPDALAVVGGTVFVAFSQPGAVGSAGNPYAADSAGTDDASTILTVNPATGAPTLFTVRGRETLALAPSADGKRLLVAWYDGVYSAANPYGAESATEGVSSYDPATKAETVLFSQAVAARARGSDPQPLKPRAVAALGTEVFVALSRPGNPSDPRASAVGDTSTVVVLNPTAKTMRMFPARDRETLALTPSADGKALLAAFYDGSFGGGNPYGADSATEGVFTIDPASGADTLLFTQTVVVRAKASDPEPAKPTALAVFGGQVFLALSQPGNPYGTGGSSALDDSSTILTIDSASKVGAVFSTLPRETLALAVTPSLARTFVVGGGAGAGPRARTFDESGATKLDFFAFDPAFLGGVRVAQGDLNGDGVDDVVAATGPGVESQVKAFDGKTGAELKSFFPYEPGYTNGVFVAVGDVTGDGKPDIVTGTSSGGAARVRVFDGATLDFAPRGGDAGDFFVYDPNFRGGVRVAVGNIAGDGVAEIVTGAGVSGGPHVQGFSVKGGTRTQVANFFAYDTAFRGGIFVAVTAAGQIVTGPDGVPNSAGTLVSQLFAGLPNTTGGLANRPSTDADLTTAPEVRVFDNLGTQVASTRPYADTFANGVRVSTGTGSDGASLIYAAAGETGGSRVKVYRQTAAGLAQVGVDVLAFEDTFLGSVYVGGSNRPVGG